MKDLGIDNWFSKGFQSLFSSEWNTELGGKPFYDALWYERKIRFEGNPSIFDSIDELNARLICCAIYNRKQILIILPDSEPRRPASLFASALLMTSVNSIKAGSRGGRVLYFGTKLGIRNQLPKMSIRGQSLSSVFSQIYGRGSTQTEIPINSSLPAVICIYSPTDPASIISKYRPGWVALDCEDVHSIPWLRSLLEDLHSKGIPIIGWSSNPLSSVRKDFTDFGAYVFKWPSFTSNIKCVSTEVGEDEKIFKIYTSPYSPTKIVPCIVSGQSTQASSSHLELAQQALARAMSLHKGRLESDAISAFWQYLRTLEKLVIPIDLYETESSQFWGITSISHLKKACEKFLEVIISVSSKIGEQLESAYHYLTMVEDEFQKNSPPRWNALLELCIEDVPDNQARIIVFQSRAHKMMFSFSLLARMNISEEDLSEMNVYLLPFKDAANEIVKRSKNDGQTQRLDLDLVWAGEELPKIKWDVIHASLPTGILSQKMTPFFGLDKFEILVYPHQLGQFSYLAKEWGRAVGIEFSASLDTISSLSRIRKPEKSPDIISACFTCEPRMIAGKATPKEISQKATCIWEPKSELEEVLLCLDNEESSLSDDTLSIDSEESETDGESYVESAFDVKFSEGWYGLFALNQKVNVIRGTTQGDKVEQLYIRSLKSGDKIIYIHGQKRQSLYDLIISRVHNHPSIEIHLVLIQQWQTELRQAYLRWIKSGKTLFEAFLGMKSLGSKLETEMALRYWVVGETLRPRDKEDLQRIAEVLGMPFTIRHYKRIHAAGDRIHGLHISLSLRLNTWIQRGAASLGGNEDLIDDATGLTFSDVQDSLLVLRVETCNQISGVFHKANLGLIERGS